MQENWKTPEHIKIFLKDILNNTMVSNKKSQD